jgi:DNA processing protein
MFVELSEDEKRIVELLRKNEYMTIDELNFASEISSSYIAAALLNLEMLGVLQALPGKQYRLTD